MCLLLVSMVALALPQLEQTSPPDNDIGYEQMTVAQISLPGIAFAIDQQLNIVGWQTPVTLNMEVSNTSAQVLNIICTQTPEGYVGVTLVSYRWPRQGNEMMNLRNNYTCNYAPDGDLYSFTSSRADLS